LVVVADVLLLLPVIDAGLVDPVAPAELVPLPLRLVVLPTVVFCVPLSDPVFVCDQVPLLELLALFVLEPLKVMLPVMLPVAFPVRDAVLLDVPTAPAEPWCAVAELRLTMPPPIDVKFPPLEKFPPVAPEPAFTGAGAVNCCALAAPATVNPTARVTRYFMSILLKLEGTTALPG